MYMSRPQNPLNTSERILTNFTRSVSRGLPCSSTSAGCKGSLGGMTSVMVSATSRGERVLKRTSSTALYAFPGARKGLCPAPEFRCICSTWPSERSKVVYTFRNACTKYEPSGISAKVSNG